MARQPPPSTPDHSACLTTGDQRCEEDFPVQGGMSPSEAEPGSPRRPAPSRGSVPPWRPAAAFVHWPLSDGPHVTPLPSCRPSSPCTSLHTRRPQAMAVSFQLTRCSPCCQPSTSCTSHPGSPTSLSLRWFGDLLVLQVANLHPWHLLPYATADRVREWSAQHGRPANISASTTLRRDQALRPTSMATLMRKVRPVKS